MCNLWRYKIPADFWLEEEKIHHHLIKKAIYSMPPIRDILYLKCQGQERPEWYWLSLPGSTTPGWVTESSSGESWDGSNTNAYSFTFQIPNEIINNIYIYTLFLISLYLISLYLTSLYRAPARRFNPILPNANSIEERIQGQSMIILVDKEEVSGESQQVNLEGTDERQELGERAAWGHCGDIWVQ